MDAPWKPDEPGEATTEFNRCPSDQMHAQAAETEYIQYDLDGLIAAITADNRHELIDFGDPVGREMW